MAIAELTPEAYVALEAAAEQAGKGRLAVHDVSRVEWSLSLPPPTEGNPARYPLPLPTEGTSARYSLRVALQVPHNAFVRHVPWDQMQAFTRLDGPAIT